MTGKHITDQILKPSCTVTIFSSVCDF
uniref:Uncharacterized protein n=1 Tax=Anguilla anguilla TaxID=7936 RepID=A0A0E9W421_ANGAN